MNFNVAGPKKGLIDLRIKGGTSNFYGAYDYFETSGIVSNPANGNNYIDFSFPLKEMLSQQQYSHMAIANNKTHGHGMKLEARFKNLDGSNQWSQWEQLDQATFKHRCTPQLQGGLQGGNGGGIHGYNNGNNGGNTPAINGTIQTQPVDPSPAPKLDKVQPKPATQQMQFYNNN
ncbi:MAG: hypothetical protein AAF569_08240 [Pseudomonadota bacterium]